MQNDDDKFLLNGRPGQALLELLSKLGILPDKAARVIENLQSKDAFSSGAITGVSLDANGNPVVAGTEPVQISGDAYQTIVETTKGSTIDVNGFGVDQAEASKLAAATAQFSTQSNSFDDASNLLRTIQESNLQKNSDNVVSGPTETLTTPGAPPEMIEPETSMLKESVANTAQSGLNAAIESMTTNQAAGEQMKSLFNSDTDSTFSSPNWMQPAPDSSGPTTPGAPPEMIEPERDYTGTATVPGAPPEMIEPERDYTGTATVPGAPPEMIEPETSMLKESVANTAQSGLNAAIESVGTQAGQVAADKLKDVMTSDVNEIPPNVVTGEHVEMKSELDYRKENSPLVLSDGSFAEGTFGPNVAGVPLADANGNYSGYYVRPDGSKYTPQDTDANGVEDNQQHVDWYATLSEAQKEAYRMTNDPSVANYSDYNSYLQAQYRQAGYAPANDYAVNNDGVADNDVYYYTTDAELAAGSSTVQSYNTDTVRPPDPADGGAGLAAL